MALLDVFQLNIVSDMGGEYAEQVLHLQCAVDGGTIDPLILAGFVVAGWRTSLEASYLACFAADFTLQGYKCKRINPTGGPTYPKVVGTVGTVSGVSQSSALGACLLISYMDTTTSKYRTGRSFMPSCPLDFIEENSLSTTYKGFLDTLTNNMEAPLVLSDGSSWNIGVWSKKRLHFYPSTSDAPPNWYYSGKAGVQRRRLRPSL
jgi:hypothetical protein